MPLFIKQVKIIPLLSHLKFYTYLNRRLDLGSYLIVFNSNYSGITFLFNYIIIMILIYEFGNWQTHILKLPCQLLAPLLPINALGPNVIVSLVYRPLNVMVSRFQVLHLCSICQGILLWCCCLRDRKPHTVLEVSCDFQFRGLWLHSIGHVSRSVYPYILIVIFCKP